MAAFFAGRFAAFFAVRFAALRAGAFLAAFFAALRGAAFLAAFFAVFFATATLPPVSMSPAFVQHSSGDTVAEDARKIADIHLSCVVRVAKGECVVCDLWHDQRP